MKSNAKTIVHEIGHIAGLWHTFQYENDGLEDFLENGTPNMMSYQIPGEGKYGFEIPLRNTGFNSDFNPDC